MKFKVMQIKKTAALLACILVAASLSAKAQTTFVTELAPNMYNFSSSNGSELVTVIPLGGGSYSFFSNAESGTVTSLVPGAYTVTTSNGGAVGTAYIYSQGSGRYSFSNPTTGASGMVQSMSATTAAIPLPALAVQPVQNNVASLYLLALGLRQQCEARGGIMYKEHWYSSARCVSPNYIYRRGNERSASMKAKK